MFRLYSMILCKIVTVVGAIMVCCIVFYGSGLAGKALDLRKATNMTLSELGSNKDFYKIDRPLAGYGSVGVACLFAVTLLMHGICLFLQKGVGLFCGFCCNPSKYWEKKKKKRSYKRMADDSDEEMHSI
jgi:hypothetical protein